MTRKDAEAACASCVLHELDIICRISRYHELNPFNPYSMLFRDDFRLLYTIADRMHKDLDSKLSDLCEKQSLTPKL